MKKLIALLMTVVLLCSCMAPSVTALADNAGDLWPNEQHFIVRHWHSVDDNSGSSFQGSNLEKSGDRYFTVVEGYIVPTTDATRRPGMGYVDNYHFWLVCQSDTTIDGTAYQKGDRVEIRNAGYVDSSNYVDGIDHETGAITLSPNALKKSDGITDAETFSSYSVSAGYDAVEISGDNLTITYDPYVHLVKTHAFYVSTTVDTDDGVEEEFVSGAYGAGVSAKAEIDTASLYTYTKTAAGHTEGEPVKLGGDYVRLDEEDKLKAAGLVIGEDKDVVLTKFYNSSEGLHTDKTATLNENLFLVPKRDDDGNLVMNPDGTVSKVPDGRTFDIDLEAWYSEGYPAQVAMILDASFSMAVAADMPTRMKLSGEEIRSLNLNPVTGDPNAGGDSWEKHFLTDDQINAILNPHMTDNSLLGVSGYSYYVITNTGEYMPLGYWEGLPGAHDGNYDFSNIVGKKQPAFNGNNGFSIKESGGSILLDAIPSDPTNFTISFTLRTTNAGDPKDEKDNTLSELIYIGPMSGNTATSNYFSVYRDQGTSRNRLRGNQLAGRGTNFMDVNTVFNTATNYTVTLIFKDNGVYTHITGGVNQSTPITSGTSTDTFRPLVNQDAEGNELPVRIVIGGLEDNYNGANIYIDEVYVIDRAISFKEVETVDPKDTSKKYCYASALNETIDDNIGGLLGHYSFTDGSLANSAPAAQPGAAATALGGKATFVTPGAASVTPPGMARTWDGRELASINRTGSTGDAAVDLNHTRAGWYYVTGSGNYGHYTQLGTGKRMIGLNGTKGEFSADNNGTPTKDASGQYIYKGQSDDTPIKFYVDGNGYLGCFFATTSANNKSVQGSYIYELTDSEYVRTEALQRALGLFITELHEYSPMARVSAVRYSMNYDDSANAAENARRLSELILLDWTNDPDISTGMLSMQWGDGITKGTATGYETSDRSTPAGIRQYNYGLTGSTATERGLQAYIDHLEKYVNPYPDVDDVSKIPRYIILFTDGNNTNAKTQPNTPQALANRLKDDGYVIYTVLLDGGAMSDAGYQSAEEFLTEVAGKKAEDYEPGDKAANYFYSVKKIKDNNPGVYDNMNDADILMQVFVNDILTKIADPLTDYIVTDYIDPRFDLVDRDGVVWHLNAGGKVVKGSGAAIDITDPANFTLDEDGDRTDGVQFPLSDVGTDKIAQMPYLRYSVNQDMYYLEWADQIIPGSPVGATSLTIWNARITIRAKDDFIGGNAILSNGQDGLMNYVRAKGDRTPSSGSGQAKNNWSDGAKNPEYLSKGFPRTSVNVTPPREDAMLDQVIYMGEALDKDAIAEMIIRAAQDKAGDSGAHYYWEYIERFVDYFRNLHKGGDPRGIIDKLHEMNRSGDYIPAKDPDDLKVGKMKIISNRIYDLIKNNKLSIEMLSELLISPTTVMDDEKSDQSDGNITVPDSNHERFLYIPYIYLPNDHDNPTNSTGKGEYEWDVIGYLFFHIDEQYNDEGKEYPLYPDKESGGITTDNRTRMSQLTVSFLTRNPKDRASWNNSQAIREAVYKRDTTYKPAPGAPIEENIVIKGTFTSEIVSGEIALQVLVDEVARAKLLELNQTVAYTADLYLGDAHVGTFAAQIKPGDSMVNATIEYLGSYAVGDPQNGIANMADYGLPYGVYTLKNGRGANVPDDFAFSEIQLISDQSAYDPALFSRGVGNDKPQEYIADISGDAFVLGDKKAHPKDYTNYRFGLAQVTLTAARPGELTITKEIRGNAPADVTAAKTYTFIVTGPDKVKGKTCDGVSFDANGRATVSVTGTGSVRIKDLPVGDYTVAEDVTGAALEGYSMAVTGGGALTLTDTHGAAITITNTYAESGSLVITKMVEGDVPEASGKAYTFTVTGPAETAGHVYGLGNGGTVTFDASGKAEITVIGEGSVSIAGLPVGLYTVAEDRSSAAIEGCTLEVSGEGSANVTRTNGAAVAVTNRYLMETATGSLMVRKQVTGNAGDKQAKFAFMVMLSDTGLNGTYGDMVFSNGVAMFTLRHGESITAADLPAGVYYSVSEQSANQDGYETAATGQTGTIAADETATAIFVNAKDVAEVPQTGDGSLLALWLALVAASLLGMTACAFTRGKESGRKAK